MGLRDLSEKERDALSKMGINELLSWQDRQKAVTNSIVEWKTIGAEFRDKYGLTTPEALNLLRLP